MPAEDMQIRTKRTKVALQLVGNSAAGRPCAAVSDREHERVTCVTGRLLSSSVVSVGGFAA